MKYSRPKLSATLLLIILMPILLGVLAALQYSWLTEISRTERERLQVRLQADVQRFAQDFNAEISKPSIVFQLDAKVWEEKDYRVFAERFDLWRANTPFSDIISEIYFITGKESRLFDSTQNNFNTVDLPIEIASLSNSLFAREKYNGLPNSASEAGIVDETVPALIIPIYERVTEFSTEKEAVLRKATITSLSSPKGFVVLKLNREAIINEMLPNLIRKHFATDYQSYNFSITSRDKIIFQSAQPFDNAVGSDASINFFNMFAGARNILVLNNGNPRPGPAAGRTKFVRERIDRKDLTESLSSEEHGLQNNGSDSPSVRIMESDDKNGSDLGKASEGGPWLLSVQHRDGSLEDFVGKTKWRNLGLSFGVLALLGTSVVLLVISAQRSRRSAQRQFDFVSSVSHEFRTPVSVICSAGANLALGIVRDPGKVENYGNVINREGNRLAGMVEQILAFAGARSNHKNYVFESVAVAPLIEQVLIDFRPLLDESGITVERQIAADLPSIDVDPKALRLALENLFGNAVKYSGKNRWIKVSAIAADKYVSISIEDKGIGVDKGELKDIFEPFYRGREVASGQIHGNGLGLSLVKQIVEAHGGKIEVQSERGKGSKFTIHILSRSNN